jgi:hypothetical protein
MGFVKRRAVPMHMRLQLVKCLVVTTMLFGGELLGLKQEYFVASQRVLNARPRDQR